ncbi:hypothetical protein R1sor_025139 [Riccia sorocarpa]|uniref:Uncharacterized protein n=1 Tax=Riccia sorocarpa TaxID=122646 RepID=A0ABD3GBD3_9MARC
MPHLSKKTSSKRSIEIIDSLVSHNTRFKMQQRETVEEFCKFIGSPGVVQKKDVGEVLKKRDGEDVEKTVPDGDDITTGGNGREKCQVGNHIARSHEEFFQEDTDRISLGFEGRRAPQEGSSSASRKGVKRRSLGSSVVTRLFEGEEGWDVEGRVRSVGAIPLGSKNHLILATPMNEKHPHTQAAEIQKQPHLDMAARRVRENHLVRLGKDNLRAAPTANRQECSTL